MTYIDWLMGVPSGTLVGGRHRKAMTLKEKLIRYNEWQADSLSRIDRVDRMNHSARQAKQVNEDMASYYELVDENPSARFTDGHIRVGPLDTTGSFVYRIGDKLSVRLYANSASAWADARRPQHVTGDGFLEPDQT